MSMNDIDYGTFDPNKFKYLPSDIDSKLLNPEKKLDIQTKITLGKELSKLEINQLFNSMKNNLSESEIDKHYIELTEKYIEIKSIQEKLKTPVNQMLNDLEVGKEGAEEKIREVFVEVLEPKKMEEMEVSAIEKITEVFSGKVKDPTEKKVAEKFTEKQKAQMASLFHIDDMGDEQKEIANKKKQELMELMVLNLPINNVSEISEQARKYPILQAAIEEIQHSAKEWDYLGDDYTALAHLKGKLEQQFKNLVVLSDIISELAQRPDDSVVLSILTLLQFEPVKGENIKDINKNFKEFFHDQIAGKRDLTELKAKEFVKGVLKHNVEYLKEEFSNVLTTEDLAEQRAKAPVTDAAIQLQAELHRAIREGKLWAATQLKITPNEESANEVFNLGDISFFKIGAESEPATGVMEKMMWDIAVVIGLEEQFVPTGETEVRSASQLVGGKEKVMQWSAEGELHKIEEAKKTVPGGIQVAQKGMLLRDYLKNPTFKISKAEITKGLLTSAIFGMFDAHNVNIFITEEGKIKYFDNTLSLPNSNGFINRGKYLEPSYRCSLLKFPEAREKLTNEEIYQIQRDITAIQKKMIRLREYLKSPQAQAQLKKLPPGWMNIELSIGSMERRIDFMQNALKADNVQNLQQLIEAANPAYRFAFALMYLNQLQKKKIDVSVLPEEVQKRLHGFPMNTSDDLTFQKDYGLGFDIKKIEDWCNNLTLSLEAIIKNLQVEYENKLIHQPSPIEIKERSEIANQILKNMFEDAAVDYKDLPRNECEEFFKNKNQK